MLFIWMGHIYSQSTVIRVYCVTFFRLVTKCTYAWSSTFNTNFLCAGLCVCDWVRRHHDGDWVLLQLRAVGAGAGWRGIWCWQQLFQTLWTIPNQSSSWWVSFYSWSSVLMMVCLELLIMCCSMVVQSPLFHVYMALITCIKMSVIIPVRMLQSTLLIYRHWRLSFFLIVSNNYIHYPMLTTVHMPGLMADFLKNRLHAVQKFCWLHIVHKCCLEHAQKVL